MSLYGITVEMRDKASAVLEKFRRGVNATAPSMDKLGKEIARTTTPIRTLGITLEGLEQQLADLKRKRLTTDVFDTRKLKEYNREIAMLDNRISRLKTGGMKGGMRQFRLEELAGNIPGLGIVGSLGGGAAGVAAGAGAAIGGAIALGNAAADKSMAFEDAMATINATALYDAKELAKLKNTLLNIAGKSDVEGATDQIASSFDLILGQLGDVNKSIEGTKVANFLTETFKGTQMAESSAALSNIYSALGGKKSFQSIANTLVKAKNYGGAEFKDFTSYMPELIPLAQGAGYDFEETAGVFSSMTATGVKGSQSAMYIQNILQALSKEDTAKELEKVGVQLFEADGKRKGLVEVFGQLSDKMQGMTDRDREQLLQQIELRDLQAKTGFNIITGTYEKMTSIVEKVASKEDALAETHNKTMTSADDLRNAMNGLDVAMIKVGDALAPIKAWGARTVTGVVEGLFASAPDGATEQQKSAASKIRWLNWAGMLLAPGAAITAHGAGAMKGGGKKVSTEDLAKEFGTINTSGWNDFERAGQGGVVKQDEAAKPVGPVPITQVNHIKVEVLGNATKETNDDMVSQLTKRMKTLNGRN